MLDYLIVYEHKARELENACLLKAELELRGYSVEIVQSGDLSINRYRFCRHPKVLVTFALYNDNTFAGHVTGVVGRIRKVVNLQYEQLFSSDPVDILYHTPKGLAAQATHVCWGHTSYQHLKDNGVQNAVMTGAMQMDFLRDELKDYYYSREEINQKYALPGGKMLLYISSFVYATATDVEMQKVQIAIGNVADRRRENARISRAETLNIFRRLLNEDSGYYIVYRPHPGEFIDDTLKDLERECPGFLIISDESVKQWILVADEVITWNSTAIAEVFYANKSCAVLRPVPVPTECDAALFFDVKPLDNFNDLISWLNSVNREFPISEKTIVESYGNQKGRLAYQNIADLLGMVLSTSEYDIKTLPRRLYLLDYIKRCIKMLIVKLKITGATWPFSRVKRVREWLNAFRYNREKVLMDAANIDEIDIITNRIKHVLDHNS